MICIDRTHKTMPRTVWTHALATHRPSFTSLFLSQISIPRPPRGSHIFSTFHNGNWKNLNTYSPFESNLRTSFDCAPKKGLAEPRLRSVFFLSHMLEFSRLRVLGDGFLGSVCCPLLSLLSLLQNDLVIPDGNGL